VPYTLDSLPSARTMWEWKVGSTESPICMELNNEGIVGTPIASLWDFHATINVLSVCLVLRYIRKQRLKAASGNYSPDRPMIFPVYFWLLVFNAGASFFQAGVLTGLSNASSPDR